MSTLVHVSGANLTEYLPPPPATYLPPPPSPPFTYQAQTIFSLGYGEDEDKEGDLISGRLLAGEAQTELVPGVRDALIGMREAKQKKTSRTPPFFPICHTSHSSSLYITPTTFCFSEGW